jgi:hypothetical protein
MKLFLTYTAIIEALTGLALIAIPSKAAMILLEAELSGSMEIILAMVAGIAILSLAYMSWLKRNNTTDPDPVKMLLFYNFTITCILLYGALGLGFKGPVLWAVIVFHTIQTVISLRMIQKKPVK